MTLADLIKEHDWDELIFGGYLCLTCTPDGDMDATGWPCPPLRAAGMTDAHAVAVIENRRLSVEVERLRVESKSTGDDGYIRGLRKAAQWARSFDQPLPGFDRPTCVQMANGLTAMAESAEKRLRPGGAS